MTTQRIYLVKPTSGDTKPRLIRATHPATALSYVANSMFTVAVAKPDDLVELVSDGVAVENVSHEQQQIPTT